MKTARSLDTQTGELSSLAIMLAALGYLPARNPIIYSDAIPASGNSGYTVANTTTETALSPITALPTFAANALKVGQVISVYARGVMTTAALLPSLVVKVKLGGATILTFSVSPVISLTNGGWKIDCDIILQAIGSSGFVVADGEGSFATGIASATPLFVGNPTPIALNTSAALPLTVTMKWGATGSSITLQRLRVYLEN